MYSHAWNSNIDKAGEITFLPSTFHAYELGFQFIHFPFLQLTSCDISGVTRRGYSDNPSETLLLHCRKLSQEDKDENQRAAVEIGKDENGISHVLLQSPRGASARVSLHGGQVRSWKTEHGKELLFISSKEILKPLATVRGGFPICFPQIDRVYLSSSNAVAVFDHERKRTYVEGLLDVVVWNPWEKKARAILEFRDAGYKKMMCVDAAAVEKPITLKPGEEWTRRVKLCVVASIQLLRVNDLEEGQMLR